MKNASNPLLVSSQLPYGAVPFHLIKTEHFAPAVDEALIRAKKNIEAIKANVEKPSFLNTIVALEDSAEDAEHVIGIFSNLLHAETNEHLQALAQTLLPKMASLSNDIYLDLELFAKVKSVYTAQAESPAKLTAEQKMLLEKTYRAFVRNGADLSPEKKVKIRELDERLAQLTQQFSDHVLKATTSYFRVLEDSELKGLPDSVIQMLGQVAEVRGQVGKKAATLDAPVFGPILKYSENRKLREELWRAYSTRATSGESSNLGLIKEIATIRFERAQLLGYSTYAHYVLEERMASDPKTVADFLEKILVASRPAAENELKELKQLAAKSINSEPFMPWDLQFYLEKLKQQKLDFDEEKIRPYFNQENVVAGLFEHAKRLYGIEFFERKDIPGYHPEVKVFEVKQEGSGEFVGLIYLDFFPRPSKQGGAWMTQYIPQGRSKMGRDQAEILRPHVSIVLNNTPALSGKPALLRMMEVRTLFHEFGHALHGLLSQCEFRSLSGPNVYWDFVELPSQIMENWCYEMESLELYAKHFETGERIPAELVKKAKEASKYGPGYQSLRQLSFGFLDMAWHAQDPRGVADPEKFEVEIGKKTALFPPVQGAMMSAGFTHVFSGGYGAGYYSYKWAEVLDADAFELFQERGIFNREVSSRFRDSILSKGGSEHPAELYRRFRGRNPDPNALLRRDGLL